MASTDRSGRKSRGFRCSLSTSGFNNARGESLYGVGLPVVLTLQFSWIDARCTSELRAGPGPEVRQADLIQSCAFASACSLVFWPYA